MVMSPEERCGTKGRKPLTIGDVKCLNKEHKQFFFSPDTMRFFKSRIASPLIKNKYFVTSEKGPSGVRKYTVRKFNRRTAKLDTVGDFQEHSTRARAISRAKELR